MSDRRSFSARLLPKLAISLVIGALFAFAVSRGGVPLVPPRASFSQLLPGTIPAYAAVYALVALFRATRWRFLIAPVKRIGLAEVVRLNLVGFFAIFLFPFRLGEIARPALTKIRHGVPISAGVGTVAVERVVDGLITSGCVAWALFAIPMRETHDRVAQALPMYGAAALTLFGGAFVVLFAFLFQRERAIRLIHSIVDRVSPRFADLVASKLGSMADGLKVLVDARLSAFFLLETFIYWGLNAFGVALLARGCGLSIGFSEGVAIVGIVAIGILLPAGPGLFGAFQLAASAALRRYVPEDIVVTQGALFIFLLYGVQSIVTLLGGLPLFAMHLHMRDVLEATGDDDAAPGNLQGAGRGA